MHDWLSTVAEKASTLNERLGPDFVAIQSDANQELIAARLRAWLAAAARGNRAAFERRLSWDGLDEETAQRAIAPVRLRHGAPLPDWTTTLAEVLQLATASGTGDRCFERHEPISFEDLLLPFVVWARAACAREASSAYDAFTPSAHATLERNLLKTLSGIASRALLVELAADVADQQTLLDRLCAGPPSRHLYEAFAKRMLSGGFVAFFGEYAALGRHLATSTKWWVEVTAELLQRFSRDRELICSTLGIAGGTRVSGLDPCESDPHNGQRRVEILRLECGERIIYKPRPMQVEAVWNNLLEALASLGAPLTLKTYRVLDQGDYGWAEYVQAEDCRDAEQTRGYVERAGALLAIVYLLGGTDCHADNLIAAGEYPVLVDVETMLCPRSVDASARADAPRTAHAILWQSVLSSYLLPWWSRGVNDGEVVDASAFGAIPGAGPSIGRASWVDVNTSRMRVLRAPPSGQQPRATATERGSERSVHHNEAAFIAGFEAMYRFLAAHRRELLQPESPFQAFRYATVRFVYRSTGFYAAIMDRLTRPEFLRDGAERSIEFEELAYAALTGEQLDGRSGWVGIWRSERDAVERGDVPHYCATPGGSTLSNGFGVVAPAWFPRCSHDLAIERLQSLDESDLRMQVDMIRSAVHARVTHPEAPASNIASPAAQPAPEDPQVWLAEALAIAESLVEQAIRGEDGSVCWIQRTWSRELQADPPVLDVQVTGSDLYSGSLGIALFLAAVERAAPGSGTLPVALGAIQPLIAELSGNRGDIAELSGIGGLFGIGSVIYTFTCLSELLDRPDLMDHAERAASLITEERLDRDLALDVTLGSAGALLGLLALYEANASQLALARAKLCGQRLLGRLEPAGNGVRAIRTLEGRFLSGFSHGQAGIAYSLCRLYRASGDPTFLDGARQLVAFERTTYTSGNGNWPDLRHPGSTQTMPSWCHGAPGIALARLASLDAIDEDETRREIARAVAATRDNPTAGGDCVCCGEFGRVEILWKAGEWLQDPELCRRAQSLAWQRYLEARQTGGYVPPVGQVGQFKCLGLFQGLAGVGYTFLQLARPGLAPEILLLDRSGSRNRSSGAGA